ncbi:Membrane associated serine protease, rhomboid family [Geodermatophilus telluris]|uniref:Membrane associated serine protease, rhomboid family n=2 Tax=Geodermatophilus telluris TaxID=1190417 RepID=A0A1G6U5Y2_9ACTN|nr:Membrane associated serine protease, rhomboid family [Geodermatophilus telluris]
MPPPATCYRHPDRPTGIRCTRCDRPICPECMVPASVGFQCPDDVRAGHAGVRAARPVPRWTAARRRFGPVTAGLVAVNVAVFVVTAVSAVSVGNPPLDNWRSPVFAEFSQIPVQVVLGEDWRLLTGAFLHIGITHLLLNMLSLLVFGPELERRLGWARYLAVYLVSALGGAVAIQLFGEPGRAVAGASAALYGLLGALGVLMLAARQDLRGLLTLLAINVVISFLPGVSLLGHLGGLVAGVLATGLLVLTRRRGWGQAAGLAALSAVLVVLALAVPTPVAVLGL